MYLQSLSAIEGRPVPGGHIRRLIGLILPLSLAGAACGEAIDPVTGGEGSGATGFAVILTDDPTNDAGTTSGDGQTPLALFGEIEGSVRVSLRNENNALVDLGADRDAFLELQQRADSLVLQDLTRPPTGTYTAIQLRFEGVSVLVGGGSEVGDTTLTQDALLCVGNGGVATVEIATLPFDVASDTDLDIVVDLNAERWITESNLDAGLVLQTDLANNVTVEIP